MVAVIAAAAAIAVWLAAASAGKLTGRREDGAVHYDRYEMSLRQWVWTIAAGCGTCFAIGMLFYMHPMPAAMLSAAGIGYVPVRKRQLIDKRRGALRQQFKQVLYALSASLSAGRSIPNALADAESDLELLYPDPQEPIRIELAWIRIRTGNGVLLEEALNDLAERSGLEELISFAHIYAISARAGGDLVEVMRRTSSMIGEKLEMEQEITVLLAQKRFEAKVLQMIPFGLVAFLSFSSPDYMEPMYEGAGHVVMTGVLIMLAFSVWLTGAIMRIRL